MLIPSAIMPDKPPDKMKEGTEVQYGKGTYDPIFLNSSKVYGLAGETMLNFGPYVVPIAFITLGIVVGKVRRCLCNWTMGDDRLLMLPFLINFCFIILASDSDNYIFFLFKNGSLASFVIFLTSDRKVIPNPNLEPRHLKSKFLNKHTLYKIEQRHKNRSLSK